MHESKAPENNVLLFRTRAYVKQIKAFRCENGKNVHVIGIVVDNEEIFLFFR